MTERQYVISLNYGYPKSESQSYIVQ